MYVVLRAYENRKEGEKRKPDSELRWEVEGVKHPTYVASIPFTYDSEKVARLVARALRRGNDSYRFKAVATIHTDNALETVGEVEP